MNNSKKILFVLAAYFILCIVTVMAQPGGPSGDPGSSGWVGDTGGTGGTNGPIDGGAILVLIAGAVYGAKKLKGSLKQKKRL